MVYMHIHHAVANCGELLPLLNGSISAPSTVAGSVARYSCHDGYNLVGVSERSCQSINGEWSDESPSCECKQVLWIDV